MPASDFGQGVAGVLRDQVGVTNVKRPTIKISYDESVARPVNGPARRSPASRPIMHEEMEPPAPASQSTSHADTREGPSTDE